MGDSPLVVNCVCGHGDDGLHILTVFSGFRIIGCPECPSGEMYLVAPRYLRALS